MRRRITALRFAAILLSLDSVGANADSYPNRTIKMIVAYAAGGGSDLTARIIASKLELALKASVVVDNRVGGLGMIGTAAAAKSEPDGYTLLMGGANAFVVNPAVKDSIPYDPIGDFEPICAIIEVPMAIAVGKQVPVTSVAELIAYLKANPGKIDFASTTDMSRLAGVLLERLTSTTLTRVPFKGSNDATQAVVTGVVPVTIGEIGSMRPFFEQGSLRPLAVTTARRSIAMPSVPTVEEATGFKDYDFGTWFGLLGPKGLPSGIVERLHGEVSKIMSMPDVREKLVKVVGGTPIFGSSKQFANRISSEIARYRSIAAMDKRGTK